MLIKIPTSSGKTGLSDLTDVPKLKYHDASELVAEKAFYSFEDDGFTYDFLLVKKPGVVKRLFVLFSGAAVGDQPPPVFQRWRWAEQFPGHCLYISDPTIRLAENFRLAWYAGTPLHEPLEVIAQLITGIAEKLNVKLSDTFSYGSSGGGYTSLRLGAYLPEVGMVAVNPQTVVTKYHRGFVDRLLKVCFNGLAPEDALELFPRKLSLVHHADTLADRRIIYVQNSVDTHHALIHQPLFFEALGLESGETKGDVTFFPFYNEGGHTKAESPEVFTQVINKILSY